MVAAANLVEVAALVGDTARATMLNALMGGQSLTATELAYCANVSRATASGHLSKLVAARLLTVTRKRRFSYYRIASPLVATMLESIKVVAAIEVPPRRHPRSANDDALRFARSCYDHLAGQVGVAVTDALVAMGHIVLTDEGGEVTSSGEHSALICGRGRGGFSASLVSTGASVVTTSRDSSELGFWIVYWSSDGSNLCRAAVRSNSRRLEGRACPKPSRSRSATRACRPVDYANHDS
jgi:DNA-binding transcriptional ArsR family regulator